MNPNTLINVLAISGGCIAGFLVLVTFMKSFLFVCAPNQLLVFSGRTHRVGGREVGYRLSTAGWTLRIPIIEQVESLDLRIMDVALNLKNAYARGGVPLNIEAIANVKISDDMSIAGNAVERFLGKNRREIQSVAKENLEGHLRGVVAKLTPEQCNEDRLRLMQTLTDEAEEDLRLFGLHLDTFNIHQVNDDTGYLEAIGREKIAIVHREVEVAKSNADRAANEEEASWEGKA